VKNNVSASFDYFMCRADSWLLSEAFDAVESAFALQRFYDHWKRFVSLPVAGKKQKVLLHMLKKAIQEELEKLFPAVRERTQIFITV
jgi:hypothetical protein